MPCKQLTRHEFDALPPGAEGFTGNPDGSPPDDCGCPIQCATNVNWAQWKPIVNGYDPCQGLYNCSGNTSAANYSFDSFTNVSERPDCSDPSSPFGMRWISASYRITIGCDLSGNYFGEINAEWSWGGVSGSRCSFLFTPTIDSSGNPSGVTNFVEWLDMDPRTDQVPCYTEDPDDPFGGAPTPGPFPCAAGACPYQGFEEVSYPESCCDVRDGLAEHAYWIPSCDKPSIVWVPR